LKDDIKAHSIRGEERFQKLMERVKHEWENFSPAGDPVIPAEAGTA